MPEQVYNNYSCGNHLVFILMLRKTGNMNPRIAAMYFIDVGLFISGGVCIITGIIKFPELTRYIASTGLVLPYNRLSFAHDWSGVILTVLVLFHVVLNWRWMVEMTRALLRKTRS
jgi:hypothetical protein